MTSTGVEALDSLLGLGVGNSMVHSLILLDECGSTSGRFTGPLQRCFIAEAVDRNEHLYLAAPSSQIVTLLLDNLPAKNDPKCSDEALSHLNINTMDGKANDEKFKIAWRYGPMPAVNSSIGLSNGGASNSKIKFDLSKRDTQFTLQQLLTDKNVVVYPAKQNKNSSSNSVEDLPAQQPSFEQLWRGIYNQRRPTASNATAAAIRGQQMMRIVICQLSSPVWADPGLLPLFLANLKSFCRHTKSVALLSIDSTLMEADSFQSCVQYADAHFQLEEIDEQTQRKLSFTHRITGGFFRVHKLPAVNSAAPANIPHSLDLLFSLRKRFFEVKVLHLPPALPPASGEDSEDATKRKGPMGGRLSCQSIVNQF